MQLQANTCSATGGGGAGSFGLSEARCPEAVRGIAVVLSSLISSTSSLQAESLQPLPGLTATCFWSAAPVPPPLLLLLPASSRSA